MFCERTRTKSLWATFPLLKEYRNVWLFVLIGFSYLVMIGTIYLPEVSQLCNTKPVSFLFFLLPLAYAAWLVFVDEARKLAVRQGIISRRFAW